MQTDDDTATAAARGDPDDIRPLAPQPSLKTGLAQGERARYARFFIAVDRHDPTSDVFQYVEAFYNRRRLHSAIAYCTPERKAAEIAAVA
jgi:transposase InsO family protein